MKNYLAVFLGSPGKMQSTPMSTEDMQKGMMAWGKWVEDHKGDIEQQGSPLGKTKKISKAGIEDIRNEMGAWVVVQAGSEEEAAKMFEGHPHFTIFPGDRVEVMECLPMPTM